MSDWFKSKKTKAITHYCGGLAYDEHLEKGTNKVRETHTAVSRFFNPVETLESGALRCVACHIEVQEDTIDIHAV